MEKFLTINLFQIGIPLDISLPSTSKDVPTTSEWSLKPKIKEEILDPTSMFANMVAAKRKLSLPHSDEASPKENSFTIRIKEDQDSIGLRKKELLSKAPRKNYDIDLYHWEEEKIQAPEIIK